MAGIDPNGVYQISGADLINMQTQAGYALAALTNQERIHTAIPWYMIHKPLNSLALMAAYVTGTDMTTFFGNGTASSTTPQSGGTDKGGAF